MLYFFSVALLCTNALAVDAPLYSEMDNVILHSSDSMQEGPLAGDQFWIVEVYANWCDACRVASAQVKAAASALLKERGARRLSSEKSSPTEFCTGVPVSQG